MERIIGRNPVLTALKTDAYNLERVYIQDSISGSFEKEIRSLCKARSIPLNRIPKTRIDRDIRGNHQGIYALVTEITYLPLAQMIEDLLAEKDYPLLLVLAGIQDVRNLGAVARSAEVFGVDGLILPTKGVAPINEAAMQSSAGALSHLKIAREKNIQEALGTLSAAGFVVIGADAKAKQALTEIQVKQPLVVMLGAEGRGIDRHLKIYCDHLFAIEQVGKVDSLNVSVANGIILYEISKRRNIDPHDN